MAHYAPDVRSDNTFGGPQEGVYQSAPFGRRNRKGMRYANDATKATEKSVQSKRVRKSQLRMRMR